MINSIKNRADRRKFFSIAGKGSIGLMLISLLPIKLFASKEKFIKLKDVKLNKQAVMRVK